MYSDQPFPESGKMPTFNPPLAGTLVSGLGASRQGMIGVLLIIALFAFELFNFDTTRFALGDLLGDVSFLGMPWAAILAIAFCAIDFAGLAHLFTPEQDEPREVWYLMGAWLLGATMNALMTWWAVNLTLLNHQFGNEVLSREQLLQVVPPFVAVLVWLTRILFIGAFSVAGEHFFQGDQQGQASGRRPALRQRPTQALPGITTRPTAIPVRKQERQPRRTHRRPAMPHTAPTLSMSARGRHAR